MTAVAAASMGIAVKPWRWYKAAGNRVDYGGGHGSGDGGGSGGGSNGGGCGGKQVVNGSAAQEGRGEGEGGLIIITVGCWWCWRCRWQWLVN